MENLCSNQPSSRKKLEIMSEPSQEHSQKKLTKLCICVCNIYYIALYYMIIYKIQKERMQLYASFFLEGGLT